MGTTSALPRAIRIAAAMSCAAIGALMTPALAAAAVGDLTYRNCITGQSQTGPAGTSACAAIPTAQTNGSNSGMNAIGELVTSPDGDSLYAATADDSVARFDRNGATGALQYRGCITG